MYTEQVTERFKKPRFMGEIQEADSTGEVGNVRCGDIMRVSIKVKDDRIADIKFKTYGCVAAIVSSDYLCELVKGKTLEEAENVTSKDVIERMGEVPAIKTHCSVLAQDALRKAIKDYRKKCD
ncbi:iron-sulfur cluster assembly scaffold protein [Candidatus Woesearchaeota archaeon]|nr:iron-sulfur cluster assembly scaffold protein [Candidatus Woesearchaeota archaeon]